MSTIVGDFNNDAKPDLTVTNAINDNTISILLGNGDRTFQNRIIYTVGIPPVSLTAGAFRDDSKLDLVVTNADENDVTVFLNSCS